MLLSIRVGVRGLLECCSCYLINPHTKRSPQMLCVGCLGGGGGGRVEGGPREGVGGEGGCGWVGGGYWIGEACVCT